MPELPEVETVRRGLATKLVGRRLARVTVRRGDLRAPLPQGFAARLQGRRIERIDRRAKYLLIHFEGGTGGEPKGDLVLLAHLGMSGRMVIAPRGTNAPPGPHDHVLFETDDGTEIRFTDPRRFGRLDLIEGGGVSQHKLLKHLGPEPLAEDFTAATLSAALAGKRTSIKAALMDQRVVAGIGNIYACEALYWADISPKRLARSCTGKRAQRLVVAIRKVLKRAIAAGGSSLRDHVQPSGELGYFQHSWAVYGRAGEACPRCKAAHLKCCIRRIGQGNRSTFLCPRRQR
jgi:formamidopyrimidine-DNA glycosylase